MVYGYARVSTKGQDRYGNGLDAQEIALRENGAQEVRCESYTGTKRHRPELDRLMGELQEGDTLIVTKLDRIARSARDGIEIIDDLLGRGVSINVLNMGKFDNTPTGRLIRTIFLAFAEFERDMIVQRTTEGKEVARLKPGYKEGRPCVQTPDLSKFLEKTKRGVMSVDEACKAMGISRATWYNRLKTASAVQQGLI